jgi:hypothetical protein
MHEEILFILGVGVVIGNLIYNRCLTLFFSVFKSVVVIAVQSDFCSEIHQNNIFLFLKNYFEISTLKQFEKIKKLILNKKI